MRSEVIENTLFLGNGFARLVFQDMPSWKELFEAADDSIDNYTNFLSIIFTCRDICGRIIRL